MGLRQELLHGAVARPDPDPDEIPDPATGARSCRSPSTPGTTRTPTSGRAWATRSSSSWPDPARTAAENRDALRDELNEKTERAEELRAANRARGGRGRAPARRSSTGRAGRPPDEAQEPGSRRSSRRRRSRRHARTRRWDRLGVSDVEQSQLLADGAAADSPRTSMRSGWRTRRPAWPRWQLAGRGRVALAFAVAAIVTGIACPAWLAGAALPVLAAAGQRHHAAPDSLVGARAAATEVGRSDRGAGQEAMAQESARLRAAEARASVLQSQLDEVLAAGRRAGPRTGRARSGPAAVRLRRRARGQ